VPVACWWASCSSVLGRSWGGAARSCPTERPRRRNWRANSKNARPARKEELDTMQRRTIRLVDFPAVLTEAERLAAGYDRAGTWTLAQVCHHLARVIELSLDGFPARMPWVMRLGARWLVLPRILRHQVFQRRFPAPDYLQP